MQSPGYGHPLPETLIMVLRTEEILEAQKSDPSINIGMVAQLMAQGIFLDHDFYRPTPKDKFILDLQSKFGNTFDL